MTSAALHKHREVYESEFVTPANLLENLRTWVRYRLKERLDHTALAGKKFADLVDLGICEFTSGACLERTRKEGGFGAFVQERVTSDEYKWTSSMRSLDLQDTFGDTVSPSELADLIRSSTLRDLCLRNLRLEDDMLSAMIDDGQLHLQLPTAKVEVVPELGGKCRVVTKSPGDLVFVGHLLRSAMFKVLQVLPETKDSVKGNRRQAVVRLFETIPGAATQAGLRTTMKNQRKIVSADLTAASDRLPRDLVLTLWDELAHLFDFPEWASYASKKLVGDQLLEYPEKGTERFQGRTVVGTRGILMGLPTTWITLSLVHLWQVDLANKRVSQRDRFQAHQPFAICGDDMIGLFTPDMVLEYESLVKETGGSFSVGKHYVSKRYGVFTEEIFEVSHKPCTQPIDLGRKVLRSVRERYPALGKQSGGGHWLVRKENKPQLEPSTIIGFKRWTSYFQMRPLTGEKTASKDSSDKTNLPWWVGLGASCSQLRTRLAYAIVRYCNPSVYHKARAWGFPNPSLPREFGGFGLPPRCQRDLRAGGYPSRTRAALFGMVARPDALYDPDRDLRDAWCHHRKDLVSQMARGLTKSDFASGVLFSKGKATQRIIQRKSCKVPYGYVSLDQNLEEMFKFEASSLQRDLISVEAAPGPLTAPAKQEVWWRTPSHVAQQVNSIHRDFAARGRFRKIRKAAKLASLIQGIRIQKYRWRVLVRQPLLSERWSGFFLPNQLANKIPGPIFGIPVKQQGPGRGNEARHISHKEASVAF